MARRPLVFQCLFWPSQQFLSTATVDEEAAEEAEEAGDSSSARGEPAFQIVGTASINRGQEPFLLQQYPVSHYINQLNVVSLSSSPFKSIR